MTENGGSISYNIVKRYVEREVGKFREADVVAGCSKLSRSSVLSQLKRLTDEGLIIRKGSGRNTFYVRQI